MKLSVLQQVSLSLSRKKRLLVMGDSHAAIFNAPEFRQAFKRSYRCFVETVGGATISGLKNPNSKTNAQVIFKNTFSQIQPNVLITQLGEVDTGFVIWYRAQKYQASVTTMMQSCIENYKSFLTDYQGIDKTIVISAPLPTIKDNQEWGEIANLRKEVTASQSERTELTVEFNARVETMTRELGLHHVNLDPESIGKNGLVAEFLLNQNRNDHHYSRQAYLTILMKHIKRII
jgi:hypothetical protein